MNFIDQLPLHIALKVVEIDLRKLLFQLLKIFLEGCAAINFRLALSQEIEIGSVDDLYFQNWKDFWSERSKLKTRQINKSFSKDLKALFSAF